MNFKIIAAAAALAVSGAAHATMDTMASGNSSVGFLSYNNTSKDSVFVDLGVNLSDFVVASYETLNGPGTMTQGALSKNNVTAVWNFATNTYTLNGVVQNIGSVDWSGYSSFLSGLAANGQTSANWGVIAGDSTLSNDDGAQHFLTTGTPTAAQLNLETAGQSAKLASVETLYTRQNTTTEQSSVDNGSYYTGDSTAIASVLRTDNFYLNWRNNLKWPSTTVDSVNSFWFVIGDGSEYQIDGTWTLDVATQTLTWQTPTVAVPEAETYAMALAGLVALGLVRRRIAK